MVDDEAPRKAATVVVLREGTAGPEALLLRRHSRSGFAADAWVFPGGAVDVADRTLGSARWRGVDPQALAGRFGEPPEVVLGLHVAAARETFEEAGLLLAGPAGGGSVDLTGTSVRSMRLTLAQRASTGADFVRWLQREGFVLELGELAYWSRWITPTAEPRRYDTCFFLARAPAGQVADHDRIETTGQRWIAPADALELADAGRLHLIYPTIRNLGELAGHRSIDELFAVANARERVRAIMPHIQVAPDGSRRIIHPDDPDYPRGSDGREAAWA